MNGLLRWAGLRSRNLTPVDTGLWLERPVDKQRALKRNHMGLQGVVSFVSFRAGVGNGAGGFIRARRRVDSGAGGFDRECGRCDGGVGGFVWAPVSAGGGVSGFEGSVCWSVG